MQMRKSLWGELLGTSYFVHKLTMLIVRILTNILSMGWQVLGRGLNPLPKL